MKQQRERSTPTNVARVRFRPEARKAIFSSSVSQNREVYIIKTSCMNGPSFLNNNT